MPCRAWVGDASLGSCLRTAVAVPDRTSPSPLVGDPDSGGRRDARRRTTRREEVAAARTMVATRPSNQTFERSRSRPVTPDEPVDEGPPAEIT